MRNEMTPRRHIRQIAVVTTLVSLSAILTACSSDNQEANQTEPAASASPSRQASLFRDSKVCVINNSPMALTVSFTKKDGTTGDGNLAPNAGPQNQACAYGQSYFSKDLEGTISTQNPNSTLYFYAQNQANNKPFFMGKPVGDPNTDYCLGPGYASVFDSAKWDNGIIRFFSIRDQDTSDYIQWEIKVTASEKPTKDGLPRLQCNS